MTGGTKDNVCIDSAFLSRHEDVLASHGYKKQKEHSIQALVEVDLKVEIRKKEEDVIKRKVCQRRRIL